MAAINVNDRVTYQGDNRPGTVTETWNNKRAYVKWDSGIEGWSPLGSLATVRNRTSGEQPETRKREECGKPIPGTSSADDIAAGRMPGYCKDC